MADCYENGDRQGRAPSHFEVERARVLYIGRIHADANWHAAAHSHPYWEFIYFLQGTGRIDVPEGSIRPQAYQLVAYPPGLLHSEISNPADPEETIYMGVDVPGRTTTGAHLVLPDPKGELRWLCERILYEYQEYKRGTPLADTYASAFLQLVDRLWEVGVPVQHDVVDLAVQYLHNNYQRNLSLQALAAATHVTESHLVHRFSAKLGISPMRYLAHIRIEAAKRLLVTTQMPVNEIAADVGVPDSLYFSKAFKRATGFSPSTYRRQMNAGV